MFWREFVTSNQVNGGEFQRKGAEDKDEVETPRRYRRTNRRPTAVTKFKDYVMWLLCGS